jgi:hypothetical protein
MLSVDANDADITSQRCLPLIAEVPVVRQRLHGDEFGVLETRTPLLDNHQAAFEIVLVREYKLVSDAGPTDFLGPFCAPSHDLAEQGTGDLSTLVVTLRSE